MNVDFAAKQREFVAYIRDPNRNPPPADVPLPRIAMYRELLFNNIDNFLSSNFPVLRQLLTDEQWFALAQDFFSQHTSTTPYFAEIPEEFLAYLQNERHQAGDLPFMLELAHYEWVEMALAIAQEQSVVNPLHSVDWLTQQISLSPLAWALAYQYPVHKIAPSFQPTEAPAQPTFLIVYRNQADEVLFLEITAMTYQLLALIQEQQPLPTATVLQQLSEQTAHPNPQLIIDSGLQIIKELAEKGIVGIEA